MMTGERRRESKTSWGDWNAGDGSMDSDHTREQKRKSITQNIPNTVNPTEFRKKVLGTRKKEGNLVLIRFNPSKRSNDETALRVNTGWQRQEQGRLDNKKP